MVEGAGVHLSPNKNSKGPNDNMESQMTQTTVICLVVSPLHKILTETLLLFLFPLMVHIMEILLYMSSWEGFSE